MDRPAQSTPQAFCALVVAKVSEHGLKGIVEICQTVRINNSTWMTIRKAQLPDFKTASDRQIKAWIRTVTRLCDFLELDLEAGLSACGLPTDQTVIEQGRIMAGQRTRQLSEEDLEALLKLVKDIGRPIPLSFALEYLMLRNEGKKE